MASVYKPAGRNIYRVEFKDQFGKTKTISSGTDDKRVAENLGMKIEEDADRIRVGMPPEHGDYTGPYLGLVAMHRGRVKWSEAADAYLTELERHGSGPGGKHHRDVPSTQALGEVCGWKTIGEATPAAITQFLGRLQAEGRSPRTQNHYLAHLRQMLAWAVKPQGWITKNPADKVEAARVGAAGRRRLRRAYGADEWRRLLAAAPPYRQTIYQVAAYSGLRRSELRRLEKQDCDPCGPNPRWKIRPEVTKNGVRARLPMLPECADAIRPTWETLPQPSALYSAPYRLSSYCTAILPRPESPAKTAEAAGPTSTASDTPSAPGWRAAPCPAGTTPYAARNHHADDRHLQRLRPFGHGRGALDPTAVGSQAAPYR